MEKVMEKVMMMVIVMAMMMVIVMFVHGDGDDEGDFHFIDCSW